MPNFTNTDIRLARRNGATVPGTAARADASIIAEVLEGLRGPRKRLPSKFFYDDSGSRLFEEICGLDEYYITRTELAIMEEYAWEMAAELGERVLLIEYGSGASAKSRLLLDRLQNPAGYVPVDISGDFLEREASILRMEYPDVPVIPVVEDFTRLTRLPVASPSERVRVVYFPGSTIGNFEPQDAVQLLSNVVQLIGDSGSLLIGIDLEKEHDVLRNAYNDARGVTAAFNLNMLEHLNRLLYANFDISGFEHEAVYDPANARIEMRLNSLRNQTVSVCDETFTFARGEWIVTEYSHKYTPARFARLAGEAGLDLKRSWTDAGNLFGVQLYSVRSG